MSSRIYIDPSITCTGIACFYEGLLTKATMCAPKKKGYDRLAELSEHAQRWYPTDWDVYFEEPVLRQRGRGPASKPADLIKLAVSAGVVIGALAPASVTALSPTDWKGSLPKEVVHRQMLTVLSDNEKLAIEKGVGRQKSLAHNLYDAVCIGLYIEGRAPWKKTLRAHRPTS